MKKTLLILVVATALVATVGARSATVTGFSGKVEYRLASGWEPVRIGLEIPLNATISTGFGANATLEVAGSAIEVAQLTRLTLEELVDDGSTVSTEVFVPVGRVRASVTTPADRSSDFRVRTAQSTAAVRGTDFETNGWRIFVREGSVEFRNELGQSRIIRSSQISQARLGGPTDPLEEDNNEANVGDREGPEDFRGRRGPSGYITVRWGR